MTTISDLPLNEDRLAELATKLKQRLGTGGTSKDGRIEIQGDHRDRIAQELEGHGLSGETCWGLTDPRCARKKSRIIWK